MKKKPNTTLASRLYITPADIARLTGQTMRNSQKMYNVAKSAFKKRKFLTFQEWADYNGDSVELIKKELSIK